ncbi:hypothetical protein MNBD_GAMMA11-1082 [hydrothermal vent metagenome]|uniref:Protein N-terminal glutamine amidohydrolase n=1 Tax=hydrothermal vent metagenome TaxID=652676 RepID=A0A3B0X8F9_9ZZZZ
MTEFNRSLCTYTPLFCEENIWKLIASFYTNKQATPIDVIFIVNPSNSVAVFEQRASKGQHPVIWDYHVILSAFVERQVVIFDFDSRCAFPTGIQAYFAATFPLQHPLIEKYRPILRAVSAKQYLKCFFSDRVHMMGVIPESAFPPYDIIQPADTRSAISLQSWIDLNCEIHGSRTLTTDEYLLNLS